MRALYQRARAHAALLHQEEARNDLLKIQRRYPKFKPVVRHEMKKLGENVRAKSVQDKKNYWASLEEKAQAAGTKKTAKKKKVVKWTDQAAKKDGAVAEEGVKKGAEEESDSEKKERSETGTGETVAVGGAGEEKEAVAAAVVVGSDHTLTKQDKAPGADSTVEDKANKSPRSGEDKTTEGAPLTATAPPASQISEGIKGANQIKEPSEIKGGSANEHPPDAAGSAVQTQPANKVVPETTSAPDTGVTGSPGAAEATETDRLAGQTDGAKVKEGPGAKQDAKKKTPTTPATKGNPKGVSTGKPKPTTPTGRANKPPMHTTKQKPKKKK